MLRYGDFEGATFASTNAAVTFENAHMPHANLKNAYVKGGVGDTGGDGALLCFRRMWTPEMAALRPRLVYPDTSLPPVQSSGLTPISTARAWRGLGSRVARAQQATEATSASRRSAQRALTSRVPCSRAATAGPPAATSISLTPTSTLPRWTARSSRVATA